jgi:catechol 2,3-dioxygenase-like lactoylglutathione lyase family enzyme
VLNGQRRKETIVPLQVTAIMIGVEDLARSKKFYGEGLGCTIDQDHPNFVSFDLGDGSSSLALYERRAPRPSVGRAKAGLVIMPFTVAEKRLQILNGV